MTAFVEIGLSRVKTEQTFTNPFFNTTGLEPTSAGLKPFAYTINFAPGVGGQSLPDGCRRGSAAGGATARYTGSLNDMGSRDAEIESDTVRFLAGLQYSFGNWDFDSAVGYSKNKVDAVLRQPPLEDRRQRRLRRPLDAAATGAGLDHQHLQPRRLDPEQRRGPRLAAGEQYPQGDVVDALHRHQGETELPAKFDMPGGNIGLALGAEWRKENLKDSPSGVDQPATSSARAAPPPTARGPPRRSTASFACRS